MRISAIILSLLVACGSEEAPTATPDPVPEVDGPPAGPSGPTTSSAAKYESLDSVPDAGVVNGTITYTGSETDPMVEPTKDLGVCENDGGKRAAGTLLVADGKLANAVVWLPDIEKGKKFEIGTVEIDNVACRFTPHVSIGQVGGKVAAKNSDPVLHNTNLTLKKKNKKIANIALPKQGQVIEKTLKKPGIVDAQCDAHEWMQGYIFTATNPYAAVTDSKGAFTMTDVPAGEHVVKVWHETLGEKEAKVTVDAGGSATVQVAFN